MQNKIRFEVQLQVYLLPPQVRGRVQGRDHAEDLGQGHVQNAGLAQNQSHGLEKDPERPGNGHLEDQGKS